MAFGQRISKNPSLLQPDCLVALQGEFRRNPGGDSDLMSADVPR
jgi:hypothetical protein